MLSIRTRRILAVMAVTTALCADQAAVASPAARPQQGGELAQMASRLVGRLTDNLRRVMPVAMHRPRCPQRAAASPSRRPLAPAAPAPRHALVSPFQFRLPPPTR